MKRKIGIILSCLLLITMSACQLDERLDDLTSSFNGAFIDKNTGDTVATEYYAAKLKLLDLAYGERAIPLEYDVNPSGVFQNRHILPADYKIWADGPFVELDTLFSNLTDFDQPIYLYVLPNMTVTIDKVELKYEMAAEVTYSYLVNDYRSELNEIGLVYSETKYPGFKDAQDESNKNALVKKRIITTTERKGTFTETLYLSPNSVFYVRALGRTEFAGDYWNYSAPLVVKTGYMSLADLPVEANLGVVSSSSAILQWMFPPVVDRIELAYKDVYGKNVIDVFSINDYSYVSNLPADTETQINVRLFQGNTVSPVKTIKVKTKKDDEIYIPAQSRPENVPYFYDRAFKMSLSGIWAEIKGPVYDPSWITSPYRWEFFDWWNTWLPGGAGYMPTCADIKGFKELKLYGNVLTLIDILPFVNLETLYFLPGNDFDSGLTVDVNIDLKVLKKLPKLKKIVIGKGVSLTSEHFRNAGLVNLNIEKQ